MKEYKDKKQLTLLLTKNTLYAGMCRNISYQKKDLLYMIKIWLNVQKIGLNVQQFSSSQRLLCLIKLQSA